MSSDVDLLYSFGCGRIMDPQPKSLIFFASDSKEPAYGGHHLFLLCLGDTTYTDLYSPLYNQSFTPPSIFLGE